MKRIFFWLKIIQNYLFFGFPLSSAIGSRRLGIGFRNRGLIDYENLELYEPELQRIIKNYNQKFVFVDIGSNIGLMSFVAFGNSCCLDIVAIEPSDSFPNLCKNLQGIAQPIKAAVNDRFEKLRIVRAKNAARDSVAMLSAPLPGESEVHVITSAETLGLVGDGQSIFLKVDIEGSERDLNWDDILSDVRIKCAAIEVWDDSIYNKISSLASVLRFSVRIFNDRFDTEIHEFQRPCNIVLDRVLG